ncbi:hypothetical protein E1162_14935 [Rhodobacteraceae bacterium RKSG542]|uniref:hypothetical protein n=1 Tax=Pseudovibrio flavus TaxID=2529854 RepID=UPI0012BC15B8|nr:hypothetical protein [Pseudovibrio flavus]MTI18538.1 hypothetical protein [Pseudovibrio flavus]
MTDVMHEPSPNTILETRFKPAGQSTTLVIVFSQARIPSGKFGLERLFAKTQHACLFLNHVGNGWYMNQEAAIDAAIDGAIHAASPTRIIYYGASMGAYGALVTGLRRQDGEIYAFGPEVPLGLLQSQSLEHIGLAARTAPSVAALLEASPPNHPVHIIFGAFDAVDVYSFNALNSLRNRNNIEILLVSSSHASHDHLYTINVIRKLITTFTRDIRELLHEKQMPFDSSYEGLSLFASAGQGDDVDLEVLATLDNAGAGLLAAELLSQSGETGRAVSLLKKWDAAITDDPVLANCPKRWRKKFPLLAVETLMSEGHHSQATELLSETMERFPIDDRMAELASKLGIETPSGH